MKFLNFILLIFSLSAGNVYAAVDQTLVAEYRLDECSYDGGQPYDVIDNSINRLHGQTINGVSKGTDSRLCTAGSFNGTDQYVEVQTNTLLDITDKITVSLWVYPTRNTVSEDYVGKRSTNAGWAILYNQNKQKVRFRVHINGAYYSINIKEANIINWLNNWHMITAVFDGTTATLYLKDSINDLSTSKQVSGKLDPETGANLYIGARSGSSRYLQGSLDEVKIWKRALSAQEVTDLYNNEANGRNWDNTDGTTTRVCRTCQCTAKVGSNMISFASDFRHMSDTSIGTVISGDLAGHTYGASPADWQIAGRTYDISVDNNSSYVIFSDTTAVLEFGKGYWVRNRTANDINYTANIRPVDFNATVTDYPDCQSANGKCVLVDLVEPNGTDNNGPYIYTLTSFPVSVPVRWENVRLMIDGTAYTVSNPPAGTLNPTIWKYDQNGNSYTNVTPDTPGTVQMIDPCYGYWVELDKNASGKDVKLLIPEE